MTTKTVQFDMQSITGIKVTGEGHKGHAITEFFTVVKKKAPESFGWHLW